MDFSGDGQSITYVSYPDGTLWCSKLDGSARLQLTLPTLSRCETDRVLRKHTRKAMEVISDREGRRHSPADHFWPSHRNRSHVSSDGNKLAFEHHDRGRHG